MHVSASETWKTAKEAAAKWVDDNAFRLSASLSYYTLFSLGPLLILATGITGMIFGHEAATGELSKQMRALIGKEGADAVEALLVHSQKPSSNILASILGVVVLLFGASGVFAELKSALNKIWKVDPKSISGLRGFIRERLFSFAMVLAIGFLLLVSLLLNTVLAALGAYAQHLLAFPEVWFQLLSTLGTFVLIALLFSLIFKILPDTYVEWRDVWMGGTLTAFLFSIGKLLIGLYLGKVAITSTYGASASVVLILLWAYYSSLILFFGAEITEVVSHRYGSRCPARGPEPPPQALPA